MAAEVHDRSAAGLLDVPEPGGVGPGMFLALFYEMHAAERSLIGHLFCLYVLRSEKQLFGVQQQHIRLASRIDHGIGFFECQA